MGNYDYYLIPRKNIIFGQWVNHSRWWPDYQIRFLKKKAVYWAPDIDIHKQPTLKGKGLTVDAIENLAILHYNYENIDDFISKAAHYAKAEAIQLYEKKQNFKLSDAINKSISEFVGRFYMSEGYKDKTHGLVLSFFQMIYFFFVYFYYWELSKYKIDNSDDVVEAPRQFFKSGLNNVNYWLVAKKIIPSGRRILYRIENKFISFFK